MATTVMIAALLAGCGSEFDSIVIGSNDFAEQKILAEIMALSLEEHGVRVERQIPSGDNRHNLLALQSGRLDLYPAYDGYLATLVPYPAAFDEPAAADGRSVAASLGLAFLEPFGYRSDFAVAVRRDVAIRHSLRNISDLAKLQKPLRFATDEGHASRAVDGLPALARHYGLVLDGVHAIPLRDRASAYAALLDREVDAAIVFTVDAQADLFGMRILEDDLGFFPAYSAGPLLRKATLETRPEVGDALGALGNKLSDETVRALVSRVSFGGEDYRQVARDFLGSLGLLETEPSPLRQRSVVQLAVEPMAEFDELAVRAFRAIHAVMPTRRVIVEITEQPVAKLRRGDVRYALLGSDAFFELVDGRLRRIETIEAVGVAGSRFAHVLVRREAGKLGALDNIEIGVGPEGGSSHRIASFLADESGDGRVTITPIADPHESVRRLQSGDIDALFFMGSTGHSGLMSLLADDSTLALRPVDELLSPATLARFPFLRRARIPAGSYPGQPDAIESFSTQAVLAAGRPAKASAAGDAGPANITGLRTGEPQRISLRTARALHAALGHGEDVDPVLPMSSGLLPTVDDEEDYIRPQPAFALLNVLAIVFLVWVISLYFRPLPATPALRSGDMQQG